MLIEGDHLQRHVGVRVLQVSPVIDKPVIASCIAVDVTARTGCKSCRRCRNRKSSTGRRNRHVAWRCSRGAAEKLVNRCAVAGDVYARAVPESVAR